MDISDDDRKKIAQKIHDELKDEEMREVIRQIPHLAQRQYSTTDQLRHLVSAAHRLGLYDAADWIRKTQGWI